MTNLRIRYIGKYRLTWTPIHPVQRNQTTSDNAAISLAIKKAITKDFWIADLILFLQVKLANGLRRGIYRPADFTSFPLDEPILTVAQEGAKSRSCERPAGSLREQQWSDAKSPRPDNTNSYVNKDLHLSDVGFRLTHRVVAYQCFG